MTLAYPIKNDIWQKIAKPMLLLSVSFHGLLLFMPMPAKKAEIAEKTAAQSQVKVTQLPNSSMPPRSIKKSLPSRVNSIPGIRQIDKQVISKKVTNPAIKPVSKAATISKTSTPIPTATPAIVSTLPSPQNLNDPFRDFPKYINSQPGSLGLFAASLDRSSQQTQDTITAVSQYFERELKAREYTVSFAKNEVEAKVFEVKKGNTTKFLNLIAHNDGTVIVLASEILNPDNINNVTKASPEEEAFVNILEGINYEDIDRPDLYLNNPGLFYAKFGADKDGFYEIEQKANTIGTIRLIPDRLPEQVFDTVFATSLKNSGFEVNLQTEYGGGNVYEVKKGTFATYLNLVPTSDRQNTVIVNWSSIPN